MANIEKIGEVTKYTNAGQFLYLFPTCNISVNNNVIDFRFFNMHRQQVNYDDVADKYTSTDAESLVDYYAQNGFFSLPASGGTQNVDIIGDSVGLNKEATQQLVLAELQTSNTTETSILTAILHESNNITQSIDDKLNVIIALLKELNI